MYDKFYVQSYICTAHFFLFFFVLFILVSCLLTRFRSCAILAASFSKSGENLNFLKYFQVQELFL